MHEICFDPELSDRQPERYSSELIPLPEPVPNSYTFEQTPGLRPMDRSLEMPLQLQDDYLTPNDRFFVCNSGTTPIIAAEDHRLHIHGTGISQEQVLTVEDLRRMPQYSVSALIECAGNHRSFFQSTMGEELNKRPQVTELMWGLGGVGMAEWRGVPLGLILEQAGMRGDAVHVCPKGGETDSREGEISIPIPVSKALDKDTILALEMNGVPLPPDHGFPVRVVVPGWIGAYSVKWVREIEVSKDPIWVTRNTEFYVMMGAPWPETTYAPAKGPVITEQNIKSSLALPMPAQLPEGTHELHGYARAGERAISAVDWSEDSGATWQSADLTGPNQPYGWVRFEFTWDAKPGARTLMTCATDYNGVSQPRQIPFNTGGYLFNAVHPHPVTVTTRRPAQRAAPE